MLVDKAGLVQTLMEGSNNILGIGKRPAAEVANYWHCHLLRNGSKRPQGGRAGKEGYQVAALHYSITSSARASREGGMLRPSVLAAFMLMINSNRVGS